MGFEKLLDAVAKGSLKEDVLSSLAGRLARLDRRIGAEDRACPGEARRRQRTLADLAHDLVEALDPDVRMDRARDHRRPPGPDVEPPADVLAKVTRDLLREAVKPLRSSPELRKALADVKKSLEQTIDETTTDEVLEARFSDEAKERARALVGSFESFCEKHKDEITALQILYSRPHKERLKPEDVKAARRRHPGASATMDAGRPLAGVRDARQGQGPRRGSAPALTDVVSLVRVALHQDEELVPFPERVAERFDRWLLQQENQGPCSRRSSGRGSEAIRDHVAANLEDRRWTTFEYAPFCELGMGGVGKAAKVFGAELARVMDELNEVLAA